MYAVYSSRCLTYALYADSLIFRLLVWMFLVINFSVALAFVVIWLICLDHDNLPLMFTHRYLVFWLFKGFCHGACIHVG